MKRDSWRIMTHCVACLAGVSLALAACADDPKSVLRNLSEADKFLLDGFTMNYSILRPLALKETSESERLSYGGILTGAGDVLTSLVTLASNNLPPNFEQPSTDAEHNVRGDICAQRITMLAGLSNRRIYGSHVKRGTICVDQEGTTKDNTQVPPDEARGTTDIQKASKPNQSRHIYIPLLASGRGYSYLLREITDIGPANDKGYVKCTAMGTAPGNDNPELHFVWELTIDTYAGYLVRNAKCWSESSPDSIYVEIGNDGAIDGDLGVLPESAYFVVLPGEFPENRIRHDLTFEALRGKVDIAVFEKVHDLIDEDTFSFGNAFPDATSGEHLR